MPLRKLHISSEISLILSAGILLTALPQTTQAQLPQYTCRPNVDSDGWVCERSDSPPSRNLSDDSNSAVLPPIIEQLEPEQPQVIPEDETREPKASPDSLTEAPVRETPPNGPNLEAEEIRIGLTANELDWMPRASMTIEQQESLPDNCCGNFIDPIASFADNTAIPAEAETLFRANQGLQQLAQNLITINGDVTVQQGFRSIINDQVTNIDREANTVSMEGNVEFREPGILLLGSSAFIDNDDNSNRIENAQYVLHNYSAHGQAQSIIYSSDSSVVSIENGEFSRCEPGNNFWKLRADNITLDQKENRGYAQNASLQLGGLPIFYYPFTLPFPLGDERSSGLLAPSTGSTRSGGFDFELPYYFNLAPHYDAHTVTTIDLRSWCAGGYRAPLLGKLVYEYLEYVWAVRRSIV